MFLNKSYVIVYGWEAIHLKYILLVLKSIGVI